MRTLHNGSDSWESTNTHHAFLGNERVKIKYFEKNYYKKKLFIQNVYNWAFKPPWRQDFVVTPWLRLSSYSYYS